MAADAMLKFPAEGFELISAGGASFTIPVKGQKLILPTKNPDALPYHNEYALSANRCTVAETPWGGMKGNYPPSFTVGSIYCPTTGVYLQDKNGANTSKYVSAGKLIETSSMAVDATAKTITEEFIVTNTNENNGTPLILDNGTVSANWIAAYGTGLSITTENGFIKVTGTTDASGRLSVNKTGTVWNLTTYPFVSMFMKCSVGNAYFLAGSNVIPNVFKWWGDSRYANNESGRRFVYPIKAPVGTTGQLPNTVAGTLDLTNILYLRIGIIGAPANSTATFYFNDVKADVGKWAFVEVDAPDSMVTNPLTPSNLSSGKYDIFCHNGSGYLTPTAGGRGEVDANGSDVNCNTTCMLDSTLAKDVYGASDGSLAYCMSYYLKGFRGQSVTKAGTSVYRNDPNSPTSYTISSNCGAKQRLVFAVMLPPSDSGRTNFSKMRLKPVLYYTSPGTTTYEFSNNSLQSTGLRSLSNPWIAMLDSSGNVGYLVFSDRPNSISYMRDESGDIYELTVDPGNAMVYRGNTYLGNQTADTDTDTIPDILEETVTSSIANALKFHDFNYEQQTQYDLSTSAIISNDFSITANSLDIIPFTTSQDDIVYTTAGTLLTPAETIATQTGNISVYDVRNQSAIRVRDTPGNFTGDCKVWDTGTVGQTDETQWKRVYDTNWIFTGDTVIENGLIRIVFGTAGAFLYVYTTAYTQVSKLYTKNSNVDSNTYTLVFTAITQNKISINYSSPNGTTGTFGIKKGGYTIDVTHSTGSLFKSEGMNADKKQRFSFGVTVGLIDSVFATQGASATISQGYYAALIKSSLDYIEVVTGVTGNITAYIQSQLITTPYIGLTSGVSAIPFDCTKLYYEAESASIANKWHRDTGVAVDANAYPLSGNSCATITDINTGVGVILTSDLPYGNYRIYFRVKATGTITNGFKIASQNLTTSVDTNLTDYLNPGSSYAFVYVDVAHTADFNQRIWIKRISATSAVNYLSVDYALIVPTGLIEKYAKRSLWNPAPLTTTVVDIPH